ncbi:MAG: universal stress protein [Chloroflexi bacterium]|nr:universal stress protein [Chloroflexota bacterium]HAL47559.1 universal stress protein [Dehalococcoidia bacterium]
MVPVTGDPNDEDMVRLACELLESSRSRVHILYVIEVERSVPVDSEVAPEAAKGEQVLKDMEQVARNYKCQMVAELVQARTAGAAVVHQAVDKGVEAIVLGTSHLERFGAYALTEPIPYILKNAPCRVLISRSAPVKVQAGRP